MDLQLKGKTAIVTGGSAGIGLAISRLLAEEGAAVTIPGRNRKQLDQAIVSLPGVVREVEADLGTAEGARGLIEQIPHTDILVNNLVEGSEQNPVGKIDRQCYALNPGSHRSAFSRKILRRTGSGSPRPCVACPV